MSMSWFGVFPRRAGPSTSPLWLWPTIGAVLALAIGLVVVDVPLDESLDWLAWPGDDESARAMLQVLAGSIITVTGLTFSLTVVALQLASQQFSPRLLRDFTRDRVIRAVLTILIGTLVFTTTVLREVHTARTLPEVGLLLASVFGLVAVAAVLAFITHIARLLRVDTMMRTVHDETDKAITTFYPAYDDPRPRSPDELSPDLARGVAVNSRTSGFVRAVNVAVLVRAARAHDLVVVVEIRPGDHVVRGTPVATVWPRGDNCPSGPAAADLVHAGITMGYERIIEQDAAFGFRQLTDIAVKALSPGINDPVTAVHAVGHMSDLLVKLVARRLGPTLHQDTEQIGRVVVPDRDLPYYVDLACGPIRRYGRREPTVLIALLRLLRDTATAARDDDQRAELTAQIDLVRGEIPTDLAEHDANQVRDLAERAYLALAGRTRDAYADRSGETRSV